MSAYTLSRTYSGVARVAELRMVWCTCLLFTRTLLTGLLTSLLVVYVLVLLTCASLLSSELPMVHLYAFHKSDDPEECKRHIMSRAEV